jgi:hypothetical protein
VAGRQLSQAADLARTLLAAPVPAELADRVRLLLL